MPTPVEAQTRAPAEAAEAVVRSAFADIDAMRWSAAASLVHPEMLARFRSSRIDRIRAEERHRNEPSRHQGRDMPPAVAAWFEEQHQKHEAEMKEFGSPLSFQFAGIETAAQLEALSAVELFARHLQAKDPREHLIRQLRAKGKEIPVDSLSDALMIPQRTVIGSIAEDDSTVQVVYRTRHKGWVEDDEGRTAVVTVQRAPEGWRLWAGWNDLSLFGDSFSYGFFVETDEEREQQLRELAAKVVTWPLEGGGEGRAFVTGYPGGMKPPKGLVVEILRADGAKMRIEIPVEAFGSLTELLHLWPQVLEY